MISLVSGFVTFGMLSNYGNTFETSCGATIPFPCGIDSGATLPLESCSAFEHLATKPRRNVTQECGTFGDVLG